MENNGSPQSLLPWLNRENNAVLLNLYIHPLDSNSKSINQATLQIISNSNPFTRMLRGQLVTETGSKVKDIFLLQQKDSYCYAGNILEQVSNYSIDANWQNNYSVYSNDVRQTAFIDMSCQNMSDGSLVPFRSLFYCQLKQKFFHPPCPDCGILLEQCSQDDYLSDSGLQPYSKSLKRYLHCPKCTDNKFYTYQREDTDPVSVFDRFQLIRWFGELLKDNSSANFLPCASCDKVEECFGRDAYALQRIVPFSFYNFYMFAFDAMSLNGLDFLRLVSGAQISELKKIIDPTLEPGRFNCLEVIEQREIGKSNFLFFNSDKWFLEVLFLKLNYLHQLALFALSEDVLQKHSDLEISLDQFWVDFFASHNLLPSLWNFSVKPLGGSLGVMSEPSSFLPLSLRLHSFVLIWFSALLMNQQQSMDDIRSFLSSVVKQPLTEEFPSGFSKNLLAAENIFWNPLGQQVCSQWQLFWDRALQLGWDVIKACQNQQSGWHAGQLMDELQSLIAEVKNGLFLLPSVASSAEPRVKNTMISELLFGIRDKWLTTDTGDIESAAEKFEIESEPVQKDEPKVISAQGSEDEIDKTVILQVENEVLETQVVTVQPTNDKNTDPQNKVEKQDEADETVILNPEELANRLKRRH